MKDRERRHLFEAAAMMLTLGSIALPALLAIPAEAGAPAAPHFAPRLTIPIDSHAHSVEADDLNGDGRLDLVVAAAGTNQVAVLPGVADGTFGPPQYLAVGKAPKNAVTGDFNRDGNRDLVVAEQDNNSIGVLLGRGDGTFDARVGYESCAGDHEILVADLNADTLDDAVVACWGDGSVASVFLGVGDGTLKPRQDLATGLAPHSVSSADFNADGLPDLVFANRGSNTVSLLLSQAGETFQPTPEIAVGKGPHSVRAADLDNDGHIDIVTANDQDNTVSLLWGKAGGFETPVDLPAIWGSKTVAAGDVNADGLPDVIVANTTYPQCCQPKGSTLRLYVNAGGRKFLDPQDLFVGGNPFSLLVRDLNGDGRTDIATANYIDMPEWLHRHSTFAWAFDAGTGSRRAKLVRLVAVAAVGFLIVVATWRRRRVAGLVTAALLMFSFLAVLLWVRSFGEVSYITLLFGS